MKILVINGPNLNLLDKRNPDIYGKINLEKIETEVRKEFPDIEFEFIQSNSEGDIINSIQQSEKKFDGLIINPGGYAHTSVAIRDALEICNLPKIEVHLSNLSSREDFRQKLLTASKCNGYISGFQANSYLAAVFLLKKIINA
ncbi:type II 3-dehydroquinate dehydratase [Melioribacteraceae bacterium 4301-Me]|uniref:type II 3-dehydroquinate dehydratase n=1 Tax=Pyranulibacter aquaticus TaxID=3163344 RepID=UPI003594D43D